MKKDQNSQFGLYFLKIHFRKIFCHNKIKINKLILFIQKKKQKNCCLENYNSRFTPKLSFNYAAWQKMFNVL